MHAHIILFLNQEIKFSLQDLLQVDKFISAEIPLHSMPHLRRSVLKHMIHKHCTVQASASCLKEGNVRKDFPNRFDRRRAPLIVIITWLTKEDAQ